MDQDLEEIANFTQQKRNFNLMKIQDIQRIEQENQMLVENEDNNYFTAEPFQPQWPKFVSSPQNHQRNIQIEEITQNEGRENILNASLHNKKIALQKRLARFKSYFKETESNCFIGRLIRYSIAERNQNLVKDLYFDCEESGVQKVVKQIQYHKDQPILLFSGQIIAAVFESLVSKDLEIQQLLNFEFPVEILDDDESSKYHYINQQRKDSIVMVIAAGPFDNQNKFGYKSLFTLVDKIKKKQLSCDILMLLGPILDMTNQKDLDKYEFEYEEYYELLIQALIEEIPKGIKVVICNSTSEIISTCPVPQPPIDIKIEQFLNGINGKKVQPGNLKFIGNPSILEIDELVLGIINEDVLSEINFQSVKFGKHINQDKIGLLISQLIQQRSFVPVFPTQFPTDWSKSDYFDFDYCPNVIITPSKFTQFAKKVDQTLFINPMSFCVANQFAVLTYNGNNSLSVIHKLRVDFEKL